MSAVMGNHKRLSDKKLAKMENKKRKIDAFLQLTGHSTSTSTPPEEDSSKTTEDDHQPNAGGDQPVPSIVDDLNEVRRRAKEAQKAALDKPKFFLTPIGHAAKINSRSGQGSIENSLTLKSIQDFICACFLPGPRLQADSQPDWCKVLRCTKAVKVAVFEIGRAHV